MNILLAPHVVFHLFHIIPVTTSHLALLAVTLCFLIFGLFLKRKIGVIPSRVQIAVEAFIDYLGDIVQQAIPDHRLFRKVFPFLFTFFITLIIANNMMIIPFMGSFTATASHASEHAVASTVPVDTLHASETFPLLHVPSTHLSMTIAFALMAVALSHIFALSIRPMKHIGNYIKISGFFKVRSFMDLINAGIDAFLGIMEMIGEFAKVISLSCRLFGNIFAEEVMIIVIMSLSFATQFVVPIPMIGLAIFGGVLQSVVFAMLATQYIGQAIGHVSAHHDH